MEKEARKRRARNPVKLIRADHKKVRRLLRDYEIGGVRRRKGIAAKTFAELEVHTRLEEELFYPAAEKYLPPREPAEEKDMITKAREDHEAIKRLIGELKTLSPGSEEFDQKFRKLSEDVRKHIEAEEGLVLPDVEDAMEDEEVGRLGEDMKQMKAFLTKKG